MPRHSKPSIAADGVSVKRATRADRRPSRTRASHQLSPPPPASRHKQHIYTHAHTHTHELSSSLLLVDDEDEDSLAGSPDEAEGELHQSHSIVCTTILSRKT